MLWGSKSECVGTKRTAKYPLVRRSQENCRPHHHCRGSPPALATATAHRVAILADIRGRGRRQFRWFLQVSSPSLPRLCRLSFATPPAARPIRAHHQQQQPSTRTHAERPEKRLACLRCDKVGSHPMAKLLSNSAVSTSFEFQPSLISANGRAKHPPHHHL